MFFTGEKEKQKTKTATPNQNRKNDVFSRLRKMIRPIKSHRGV